MSNPMQKKPPTTTEIKTARAIAKITQGAAAKLIHSTIAGYQAYEYGRRKMHPAIWELFQCKIKKTKRRSV